MTRREVFICQGLNCKALGKTLCTLLLKWENLAYSHLDTLQSGWNSALVLIISYMMILMFDHNLSVCCLTPMCGLNINALFVSYLSPLLNRAKIEEWQNYYLPLTQYRVGNMLFPIPTPFPTLFLCPLSVACPFSQVFNVEYMKVTPN